MKTSNVHFGMITSQYLEVPTFQTPKPIYVSLALSYSSKCVSQLSKRSTSCPALHIQDRLYNSNSISRVPPHMQNVSNSLPFMLQLGFVGLSTSIMHHVSQVPERDMFARDL